MSIKVVRTLNDLHDQLSHWRSTHKTIGLVPTMGALHLGHLSLVSTLKSKADKVVATIFVNPTQFGPGEDYDSYPRTEDADVEKLASVGTDLVFIPSPKEMYPDGFKITVKAPEIGRGLCDANRPGHFDGVATIVYKLLTAVDPNIAIFGEKDFQQLAVIRNMVQEQNLKIDILGAPIVRDHNGLALSSRNAYLSEAEYKIALNLPRILEDTATKAKTSNEFEALLDAAKTAILAAGFDRVDYISIRDAESLMPISNLQRPARLLAAARIGKTRLIDNLAL